MASELQIEANRRNARKSSGPRSAAGKKRSSGNAFRHGLSKPLSSAEFGLQLEIRARELMQDRTGPFADDAARNIAEADLENARVQHFKMNLIEGIAALGSTTDDVDLVREVFGAPFGAKRRPKFARGRLPWILGDLPDPTAEAIRRALPELERLTRYEKRAAARKNRAVRALIESDQNMKS